MKSSQLHREEYIGDCAEPKCETVEGLPKINQGQDTIGAAVLLWRVWIRGLV
jgi:hypothetical protein